MFASQDVARALYINLNFKFFERLFQFLGALFLSVCLVILPYVLPYKLVFHEPVSYMFYNKNRVFYHIKN